jgi:hypothetical protein
MGGSVNVYVLFIADKPIGVYTDEERVNGRVESRVKEFRDKGYNVYCLEAVIKDWKNAVTHDGNSIHNR